MLSTTSENFDSSIYPVQDEADLEDRGLDYLFGDFGRDGLSLNDD